MSSLRERVQVIRDQISQFEHEANRAPGSARLLPVSKTHSKTAIREAYALGLREFGENYADELAAKAEDLKDLTDLRWVYIGQLQSNKIQKIVRYADEIQSVASDKHARYIERYAKELSKNDFPVWIVINAGNEDSKQGVSFEDLPKLAAFIQKECTHLSLQGIMAIPPSTFSDSAQIASPEKSIPDLYKRLRDAANHTGACKLSLGMTGDLRLAIATGSDCVRIGTAIFGTREHHS